MAAPGETDLGALLKGLAVARRPGRFTVVETDGHDAELALRAHASVREGPTTSHVITVADAEARGFDVLVELAWLTLTVESSLEAVGLTAHVSAVLAARDIPCNVLAGLRHDHLLVPHDRAEEAAVALTERRS